MKTKILKKPTLSKDKPKPRGKHAKIAYLKRSAAAKAVHHRRRIKKHAKFHLAAVASVFLLVISAGVAIASQVNTLIPPPGNPANVQAYINAVEAQQRARAASAAATAAMPPQPDQIGAASWYALGLPAPDALTCASRTFPRGTQLRVRDLRNGNEVICLVNDYGPAAGTNRVIDLSRGSYRSLEGLGSGTMPVEIFVVKK